MTGFESFKAQDFITAITILTIMGVLALVVGYGLLKAERKFDRYEPIEAMITKSELAQGPVGDRGSEFRSEGFRWILTLEYTYIYRGKTFTSDQAGSKHSQIGRYSRESSAVSTEPPPDLKTIQQQYQVGEKATAYVYPKTPDRSYLIRERKGKAHLIAFLIGVVLLAISGGLLKAFISSR